MLDPLMTLREIAHYAAVRPSAVSNWKRRHPDFPSPAQVTSSGTVYRSEEVIKWLTDHEKIDIPTEDMGTIETWETAAASVIRQMLRETNPDTVRKIILSLLLHTSVSRGPLLKWRGRASGERHIPLSIPPEVSVRTLLSKFGHDDERDEGPKFIAALEAAWQHAESLNPELTGLLLRADINAVQSGLVRALLVCFDEVAREGQARDLDPVHRVLWDEIANFETGSTDDATPTGLSRLLWLLANGRGPNLLDLAAGRGHLVFDAVIERWRSESPDSMSDDGEGAEPDPDTIDAWRHDVKMNAWTDAELIDPDAEALIEARIWSLIYDVPITVQQASVSGSLTVNQPVDMVLIDTPMHVRGEDVTYASVETMRWLDSRTGGSLELGFLVLAGEVLAPTGKAAIVVSTQVTTTRSSRVREARGELVNSGLVEAVIALPGNLHRGVSRPVSVIMLRGQRSGGPILLIDASAAGTQRRRTRELSEPEVDAIANIVLDWRRDGTVRSLEIARSVAIDPVDLEEHILDAGLYVAPPEIPDLDAANAQVEQLKTELTKVSGRLSVVIEDLVRRPA